MTEFKQFICARCANRVFTKDRETPKCTCGALMTPFVSNSDWLEGLDVEAKAQVLSKKSAEFEDKRWTDNAPDTKLLWLNWLNADYRKENS